MKLKGRCPIGYFGGGAVSSNDFRRAKGLGGWSPGVVRWPARLDGAAERGCPPPSHLQAGKRV